MTYETIASISQTAALFFFMTLFAGVVVYVFWPGNKRKFDHAARLPLEQQDRGAEERKS